MATDNFRESHGCVRTRTFAGQEDGESAPAQCRPSRIKKDNIQMTALSQKIEEFCNPFRDVPNTLVNLATGRATKKATEDYLLETMDRSQTEREKFLEKWNSDSTRFLNPMKRKKVNNFASENKKETEDPRSSGYYHQCQKCKGHIHQDYCGCFGENYF